MSEGRFSVRNRCLELLCSMKCVIAITFVGLATFISIVVVGVATQAFQDDIRDLKLVVDTDAGTDDAMAIMMLLESEKRHYEVDTGKGPHVIAITTVNGNTAVKNVTRNVLRILKMEDRLDISVYEGASRSIKNTPKNSAFFGSDGLGDVPDPSPPDPALVKSSHAAVALVKLVNQYPNELSMLALGPLTNIALAIRLDQDFLLKLKHLYILGGTTEGRGNKMPGVEFNFFMDPEANYIVLTDTEYRNGTISLMSWEEIEKMKITQRWRTEILGAVQSKRVQFLNAAEGTTTQVDRTGYWDFADPVLASSIFMPKLVRRIISHTVVPLTQGEARGGLVVDYYNRLKGAREVLLMGQVDVEAYKKLILDYLGS